MNIFIVPSWYPSASNPIYGTFNEEQAKLMADNRPDWNVGVSTWGQGDDQFLLYAGRPSSIPKMLHRVNPHDYEHSQNLTTFFTPTFTWTRKIRNGNINGIVKANKENLERYQRKFGKPHVISAQATYPGAIVAHELSRQYGIPYTVTIRMSPFPFEEFLHKGKLKPLIKKPLQKASMLIATSHALKQRLASFGLNATVINNPVDFDLFTMGGPPKKLTMLAVGRMEEQKGFDLLLQAVASLGDVFDGKLQLIGDGSQWKTYKKLAQELTISHKVEWLGSRSREDVSRFMRQCSFYVLSSRHETFGNVLVEALACGKAVVSTKCGGPEEIVTSELGYLCEISASSLAEALTRMLANYTNFDGQLLREAAKSNYSSDNWLACLEKVFSQVQL